jgi:hypothetical protein
MINLGITNSRVEAGLCAYSRRPSLEVIAVIALPSLVIFLLRTAIPQMAVESSENIRTYQCSAGGGLVILGGGYRVVLLLLARAELRNLT